MPSPTYDRFGECDFLDDGSGVSPASEEDSRLTISFETSSSHLRRHPGWRIGVVTTAAAVVAAMSLVLGFRRASERRLSGHSDPQVISRPPRREISRRAAAQSVRARVRMTKPRAAARTEARRAHRGRQRKAATRRSVARRTSGERQPEIPMTRRAAPQRKRAVDPFIYLGR